MCISLRIGRWRAFPDAATLLAAAPGRTRAAPGGARVNAGTLREQA